MKKQLTAVLLSFALLLTLSGCSTVRTLRRLDAAEDRIEARLDAAEDKLEDSLRNAVVPAPTVPPTLPAAPAVPDVPAVPEAPVQAPPAVTESPRMLTREQARQITLDYLNLTADQVIWLHTEQEVDDGIPQFEIELHQGDWEHEFEIHAESGQILSYDKDLKYD